MSTGTTVATVSACASAAAQATACATSRSRGRSGTAITRIRRATPAGATTGIARENGSAGSTPTSTSNATRASPTVRVNVVTQSSVGQAGNTPLVETRPRVGFMPTMPLNAAGTRPLPAVSVPSANGTTPDATATALPALLPPLTCAEDTTLWHAPYGERVPTSPVANWSRLVLPIGTAPAAMSRRTATEDSTAGVVSVGQPAVVGTPATSMLSLTAKRIPASGPGGAAATSASIRDRSSNVMNAGWSTWPAAASAAVTVAILASTWPAPRRTRPAD